MGKLKVYYGWARIGNVRKKRALSVMFENEMLGCRSDRGQRCLRTIQDTVIERYQTNEEEKEGKQQNRKFTENSIFLDENPKNGSLNKILQMNSDADKKHVSKEMRDKIAEALRKAFMQTNRKYREPGWQQLKLKFE